jgi:predicted nucleotidyltransferase component of viral defense system
VKKADRAKSISDKLSKLATARGLSYQTIAMAFLLERLLARLVSSSQLAKSLVFKGGYVGLRVYNSVRYTVDLDALLLRADVASTLKQTGKVIEAEIDDGTWFVFESQIDLKTQGEYGGVRQTFRAGLGEKPKDLRRAQIINFDIGIGDPVTPGPVKTKTPELIGGGEVSWLVYPVETIVAEKLQTLIARGSDNSRAKDIFDLQYYLPMVEADTLKEAVKRCFEFRGSELPHDPAKFLAGIDLSLLKRGWKSATSSLKDAPEFEAAYEDILRELRRVFPPAQSAKAKSTKS